MPRRKISTAIAAQLEREFEKGDKTLAALAKEHRVSSKTVQFYKNIWKAKQAAPMSPPVQFQKYNAAPLRELGLYKELVRQLADENVTLRLRMLQTGVEGAAHKQ